MAPIDGDVALSPLTIDDIDDGMALVAEAGWNQTRDDWTYMLAAGHGTGVRSIAGRIVASCMVLPYRPSIGWIGMVLVAGTHRRRGIATRLLGAAIEHCRTMALMPMLDATPAGHAVYRRLGFSDGDAIERWRGTGGGAGAPDRAIDLELARQADRDAFGADRARLLADLAARGGAPCFQSKRGWLFGRRGRIATQLGPLLARDLRTALALCERAVDALAGPLLIDVPARETELRRLLAARGFTMERSFIRMCLGDRASIGEAMRAIAGPELG